MNNKEFFKGMGMGMGLGAAVAVAFMPANHMKKKNDVKSGVGRVMKTLGDIMEGVGDAVGL